MNTSGLAQALRQLLRTFDCFYVRRGKGEYDVWRSRRAQRYFAVPHDIGSPQTLQNVLSQAVPPKRQ